MVLDRFKLNMGSSSVLKLVMFFCCGTIVVLLFIVLLSLVFFVVFRQWWTSQVFTPKMTLNVNNSLNVNFQDVVSALRFVMVCFR